MCAGDIQQELERDGHGLFGVDGGGEREFGGAIEDPLQVGAAEAVGGFDELGVVEILDGFVFAQQLNDLRACGGVRRRDKDGLIEAAGAAEGRIERPRLIGGADDEDALVFAADAVHLVEELIHEAAHLALADLAAVLREGVEIVEDHDAGRVRTGGLEELMEVALRIAVIGIKDFVQADREVVAGDFAGDGAEDGGLAAARRAVDEDAAAGFAAVGFVQIRELERVGDFETDLLLHIVHAADIGKAGTAARGIIRRVEGLGPPVGRRIFKAVVKELFGFRGRIEIGGRSLGSRCGRGFARIACGAAEFGLEGGVGERAIDLRGNVEVLDGFTFVALGEINAGEEQVGLSMLGIEEEHALGADGGAGGVAFEEEDARDAEMAFDMIGLDLEDALENLARLIQPHLIQTSAGVQQQQGEIVGRTLKGITQGIGVRHEAIGSWKRELASSGFEVSNFSREGMRGRLGRKTCQNGCWAAKTAATMNTSRRSFLTTFAATTASAAFGRDWSGQTPERYPDPDVIVLDPAFEKVIQGNAPIRRLHTGMLWAEGPAWNGSGNYLVWSDIPNNAQMRYLPEDGHVSVMRNNANNSNGNTFDRKGRQISFEHGTRRVVRYELDGSVTVLADKFDGKPLNAPNDGAEHPDGSIWFTDPGYGSMMDYEGNKGELLLKESVYRIDPSGEITKITEDLEKPNGLCFSPDYKKVYIVDTGSPKNIRVYDVDGTKVKNGKVFATNKGQLADPKAKGNSDGIRCDIEGNLWASAGWIGDGYDGVHVFNPEGKLIGFIKLPETASNVCFGGPKRNRLFITASQSLYSLYVNTRGAHHC